MSNGPFRLAALAAAILTASLGFAGENDVLYWMVDENTAITTGAGAPTTIGDFFDNIQQKNYPAFENLDTGANSAFAARVRVTGGNIQDGQDVFLDMYIPGSGLDEGGGEYGVVFSDAGGYWGAGVPTGSQSPVGGYSAGSPEYSFIVELGNIDSSDNWTTVATSASVAYSSLGDYIHQTFDINPSTLAAWTPTSFTAVPEPSGGLLMAVGLAFLALRRKRPDEGA